MATKYRQQILDYVRDFKEDRGCADCGPGVYYPYWMLQFDHPPGSDKVAGINRLIWRASHATILKEIAKCEVVCANHHADRTYQRIKHGLLQMQPEGVPGPRL